MKKVMMLLLLAVTAQMVTVQAEAGGRAMKAMSAALSWPDPETYAVPVLPYRKDAFGRAETNQIAAPQTETRQNQTQNQNQYPQDKGQAIAAQRETQPVNLDQTYIAFDGIVIGGY